MGSIRSIGTALPTYHYSQTEMVQASKVIYRSVLKELDEIELIFKNAQVEHRYFILPIEKILKLGSFVERNRIFFEEGLKLAQKAVQNCLEKSQLSPTEIDSILFVSSTGFTTPPLDAYLMNHFQFSPSTKRCSVFGWGCLGGVAGLAKANEYVKAYPQERILLVNLELCSLAYQAEDRSMKSLIASVLFNDAATAVIVEGDEVASAKSFHPRLLKSRSFLFPNSYHLMGWEHQESGLQVVLSPEIPRIVRDHVKEFVDLFLEDHSLSIRDLKRILPHSGGAKILSALEKAIQSHPEQTALSWESLRDFGNVSSCSILFTLEKALQKKNLPGDFTLLLAFGPGFSAEGLMLQW